MSIQRPALLAFVPLLMIAAGASSQEQNLTDLDLATLMSMDVTVTSAAKREQTSSDAAAAVYVITREDIRRSGATSLPEVLRMAPGVEVARISSRGWAVSARGFNSRFATKLLVLIDGRSIYTPLFSGVIWEENAVFLDEVERVEVVRGPGGAMWGINAVNGVVNIITRKAADSSGLRARVGTGSIEERSAALSYGGSAPMLGDYRVYVDHNELEALEPNGAPLLRTQLGWRLDRGLADGSFTLQGGYNDSDFGDAPSFPIASLPVTSEGGDVSARWDRKFAPGELELSSYYSWVNRGQPGDWDESAFGFDAQFNAERIGRHLFTAGIDYRSTIDEMNPIDWFAIRLSETRSTQNHWGVYVQDELHFFSDKVRVILGAKIQDLEFTGLAFQPTGRAIWHVTDSHTLWTAASRAVRTPSRIELDANANFGTYTPYGLMLMRVTGNENLKAEDLHAYELGWRWRPYQALSIDVAVYRNEYDHLISGVKSAPQFELGPPPATIIPVAFENVNHTAVEGLEVVAEWAATDWLRLEAQGTWLDSELQDGPFRSGAVDPDRILAARARVDLPYEVELDMGWRAISEHAGLGIPAYESVNARVAWMASRSIEISLSADNLFDDERIEFWDDLTIGPGITLGRTVFARLTWQPHRR